MDILRLMKQLSYWTTWPSLTAFHSNICGLNRFVGFQQDSEWQAEPLADRFCLRAATHQGDTRSSGRVSSKATQ